MASLLDERIGYRQSLECAIGHEVVRASLHRAQYQGIADTIVQLIRRSTSGVITPSQRIGARADSARTSSEN